MRLPIVQGADAIPYLAPEQAGMPSFGDGLGTRRVYIDTFGCQMNEHDTQRMVSLMASEGYLPTDDPAEADVIVLNSCSVREKAENKLRSRAGVLGRLKHRNPELVLALGGCVAQQEGKRLLERVPHADIVFGPDHLAELPEMVHAVRGRRRRLVRTEFLTRDDYSFPPVERFGPVRATAYVSVMKGCDKFCSFCIVPYTRGREVSRRADDIVDEVQRLADHGTKEVVLLGQTVNSYGRRKKDGHVPFHELLHRVASVPGIERVRFTSPHPKDFSPEQISAFRDIPELCPHMHLPVQSGSTSILKAMRRGYSREEYLDIVDSLRSVAPEVALTTDIIVGFPGERDEDFDQTMSLIEEVQYHSAYSFAYSERVGTRALKIEPSVPNEVRFQRLRTLQQRQEEITRSWLESMVGRVYRVMVEGPSRSDGARSTGRTGTFRAVHVDGLVPAGTMLNVRITEAYKHSLFGVPVSS
ncbi:MAG: tRNA (N6-isopentenyl adenosine(37)-C2)-methylthiotransferase MiaB [Myxococcota bacterium]